MGKYLPKLPFGTLEFLTTVDYGQDMERMFKESSLYRSWQAPEPREVPLAGEGKVSRLVYLVPVYNNNEFTSAKAMEQVAKISLQLGKAEDFLAVFRDHSLLIRQAGVDSVVEFGTTWEMDEYSRNMYAVDCHTDSPNMKSGIIKHSWYGSFYILAVAEDGIKRKIHQTPAPGSPVSQPKVQPVATSSVFRSASLGIPKALMVDVQVDYSQSADEMIVATGCNKDSGNMLFDKGKPANGSKIVKRRLILVPCTNVDASTSSGGKRTADISAYLESHNLQPAYAEDFLAFLREHRNSLKQAGVEEVMALGTIVDGNCVWHSSGFGSNQIRVTLASKGFRSTFWALATLKKKAKVA